jgi:hypothetical protein
MSHWGSMVLFCVVEVPAVKFMLTIDVSKGFCFFKVCCHIF